MGGFNEISSKSKKYAKAIDAKADASGAAAGGAAPGGGGGGFTAAHGVIAGAFFFFIVVAMVGSSTKVTTPASLWAGSYHTAGCDVARCCCAKNLNVREVSASKVMLMGRLDGQCQSGIKELAIQKVLEENGMVIKHTVLDFTVTYELRGGAIMWTNDDAASCNGYAYPVSSDAGGAGSGADEYSAVFYKRKSNLWTGNYIPSSTSAADEANAECCVPESVLISSTSNGYGLKLSIEKNAAGSAGKDKSSCSFRKAKGNVHTLSRLVPRSNDLELVADGQPFRFSLDGKDMTVTDSHESDEGKGRCAGVTFTKIDTGAPAFSYHE